MIVGSLGGCMGLIPRPSEVPPELAPSVKLPHFTLQQVLDLLTQGSF